MKPIENVHYWRNSNLTGVEICRVIESRHAFPNHSHENIYAVCLMEEGKGYCVGPGKTERSIQAGEITLINPGQIHSGVPLPNLYLTYRGFYFDVDLINEIARDIFETNGVLPEFRQFVVRDQPLFILLKLLSTLLEESRSKLELDSVIFETIASLLTAYGSKGRINQSRYSENKAVQQAKEYLTERLSDRISLDEIANVVGLSRYHFLRTFKRGTGLSPHVYRTQHRIEAAKRLLKNGLPLAEIALETGFSDQSHFTNKFRQFTGATPFQYLAKTLA